jgi:hypothetical protein
MKNVRWLPLTATLLSFLVWQAPALGKIVGSTGVLSRAGLLPEYQFEWGRPPLHRRTLFLMQTSGAPTSFSLADTAITETKHCRAAPCFSSASSNTDFTITSTTTDNCNNVFYVASEIVASNKIRPRTLIVKDRSGDKCEKKLPTFKWEVQLGNLKSAIPKRWVPDFVGYPQSPVQFGECSLAAQASGDTCGSEGVAAICRARVFRESRHDGRRDCHEHGRKLRGLAANECLATVDLKQYACEFGIAPSDFSAGDIRCRDR